MQWRKSVRSKDGDCVEVAYTTEAVYVRDSKDPGGPVLSFTPTAWQDLLDRVRAGELDHG
jgi:hypothetical protein